MSRILKLRKKKITMSQDDLSCEVLTKMDGV